MSNTPILINLRATEWEQIATILEFTAVTTGGDSIITKTAEKFASAIRSRIEESS
jgi:hypothetical protein